MLGKTLTDDITRIIRHEVLKHYGRDESIGMIDASCKIQAQRIIRMVRRRKTKRAMKK